MAEFECVVVNNPSTRQRSAVWEYFGFWQRIGQDGRTFVDKSVTVCKLCKFECRYTSNTTNLSNHVRMKHPDVAGEAFNKTQIEFVQYPDSSAINPDSQSSVDGLENEESGTDTPWPVAVYRVNTPDHVDSSESTADVIVNNPSTRQTSAVWEYFGFWQRKSIDGASYIDKSRAVCKICQYESNYSSNTTNLREHLRVRHSEIFAGSQQNQPSFQSTPISPSLDGMNYDVYPQRTNNIMAAVGDFVVSSLMPISIVESEGFQHLMEVCGHKFKVPSSEYISKILLPRMHEQTTARIQRELTEVKNVGLCIELWKSVNMETFGTITCQFLTKDWQFASYVLATKKLPETLSGNDIAAELQEICSSWNLPNITAVTSGSNVPVINAIKHLGWQHIPCLGGDINCAVRKALALKEPAQVIKRSRDLVNNFKSSLSVMQLLHTKQEPGFSQDASQNQLILDKPTTWNSTLDMLERIIQLSATLYLTVLDPAVKQKGLQEMLYTLTETELVENMIRLLKPMKEATLLLSQESCPTISLVLPTIEKLNRRLQPSDDDSKVISGMKKVIINILERHSLCKSSSAASIVKVACLLDPRFKSLPFVDENTRKEIHNIAISMISSAHTTDNQNTEYSDSVIKVEANVPSTTAQADQSSNEDLHRSVKRRKTDNDKSGVELGDWFADVIDTPEKSTDTTPNCQARHEMDRYLSERPLSPNGDPLSWWKARETAYPLLAQLSRKVLAVPACSTHPEKVFSNNANHISNKYAMVSEDCTDMLIFLNKNRDRKVDVV